LILTAQTESSINGENEKQELHRDKCRCLEGWNKNKPISKNHLMRNCTESLESHSVSKHIRTYFVPNDFFTIDFITILHMTTFVAYFPHSRLGTRPSASVAVNFDVFSKGTTKASSRFCAVVYGPSNEYRRLYSCIP
jgi:hypothetical protein